MVSLFYCEFGSGMNLNMICITDFYNATEEDVNNYINNVSSETLRIVSGYKNRGRRLMDFVYQLEDKVRSYNRYLLKISHHDSEYGWHDMQSKHFQTQLDYVLVCADKQMKGIDF